MKGSGWSGWSRAEWLLVLAVVVLAGVLVHGYARGHSAFEGAFASAHVGFGELAIIFLLVIVFLGPPRIGRR